METRTKTRLSIAIIVTAAAAMTAAFLLTRPAPLPDDVIKVNGRTEADHYLSATKVGGKVIKINRQEGDAVKEGDVLAQLDDAQIRAKVTQAAAAYGAVLAQYKAAQTGLEVLQKQVPLKIATAKASVTHAQAQLKAAQANEEQALKDLNRMQALLEKGSVNQHRVEQARLAYKTAKANRITAETAVNQAQKLLDETELGWDQIKAKTDEVNAVKAQTLQAQAALMEAMSVLNDMRITAPIDGVITTQLAHEGEVLAPGSGLFDQINLDKIYLKGYVAEKNIGKIHLGQKAEIHFDSLERPYPATIRFISSQTEFTPKEVQTQDERVKLVYAVKFYLDDNPQHRITPGLPADAYVKIKP
jgi:HlyD family secretion protein